MGYREMAELRQDWEELSAEFEKQIAEWEAIDSAVSPKDDEYKVTFYNEVKPVFFTYRARNKFQAIRYAFSFFEDFEVWDRVYTKSMKVDLLDNDSQYLETVIDIET